VVKKTKKQLLSWYSSSGWVYRVSEEHINEISNYSGAAEE